MVELNDISADAKLTWDRLAEYYESRRKSSDSLDILLEFPAQLEAVGNFKNKSILDLGCGSGEKALFFAQNGASKVIGVDISEKFISAWTFRKKPNNLNIFQGNLNELSQVKSQINFKFDIVTLFQAIQYCHDLKSTVAEIKKFLKPTGYFVLAISHPFRFAQERAKAREMGLAASYRDRGPHTFPSMWNADISVSHFTYTFSDLINAFSENGFAIERCWEPDLTADQRQSFPHKAKWMDDNFGIIVYRLRILH